MRTAKEAPPLQTPAAQPEESAPLAQTKRRIRVLLADDHPIVRRGIAACLSQVPSLELVAEASNGTEALRKAKELKPDLVLADIDMPQLSGLALTESLRRDMPQVKVVILSMHRQNEFVLRILQSGARGYVLKDAPTSELVQAIETVFQGETFFSPEIARVALNQFVRGAGEGPTTLVLTNRELEVLSQIAEGLSNKEIACRLGVGVRTVETHRERLMRKLNIHSVAGLTRFAIAKGLVALREEAPPVA